MSHRVLLVARPAPRSKRRDRLLELFPKELPKQLQGVRAQRLRDSDELDDIQPSLAALVLGDERLRLFELHSERMLPNARLSSHRNKKRDETGVFGGSERFVHGRRVRRIGSTQSDPGTGLSQNRIILTVFRHGSTDALDFSGGQSEIVQRRGVDASERDVHARTDSITYPATDGAKHCDF